MDMDEFRSIILKDFDRLKEDKDLLEIKSCCTDGPRFLFKDIERSDEARVEGNALFTKNKLDNMQLHKILQLYNKSLARAPLGSEVQAKAYANKSTLLLRMRKYKESIVETEKALKITNSVPLKVKLLCRKAENLTALGSPDSRSCLEKAKFILSKSDVSTKMRKLLIKTLDKVQVVVNEEKLDTPKDNKRIKEVSKMIVDAEERNIWSSVEIHYSEKYGRHLVAARDFKPGEIILVEKPYLSFLKEPRSHQYCYKCLNYLWTAVPCDECHTNMFCSEECKNQAWEEYHELECSLIPQMKFMLGSRMKSHMLFLLSIFFKTLREAGSVGKLQTDFQSLKYEDPCSKDLTYRTILASPIFGLPQKDLEFFASCSTLILICLAKLTPIFGQNYEFYEIEKLMKNDKALFTGSLFLKFMDYVKTWVSIYRIVDPTIQNGSADELYEEDDDARHMSATPVLNLLDVLTTVGCIPNALKCRSIDHKSVMYALQPIKAGTRLIDYHRSYSTIYNSATKSERQASHRKIYKSSCDCRACTEDWSIQLDSSTFEDARTALLPEGLDTEKFNEDFESMIESQTLLFVPNPNFPDIKTVNKMKSVAAQVSKYSPLPSPRALTCTIMMVNLFKAFFSPDKDIFKASK